MGQTPAFNLHFPPLEPEHQKKTFNCYKQADCLLPANAFSFPWLAECQSRVLKKGGLGRKGLSLEGKKREFPRQELGHPIPCLQGEESPLPALISHRRFATALLTSNYYIAPSKTANILFGRASRFLMHASTCPQRYC